MSVALDARPNGATPSLLASAVDAVSRTRPRRRAAGVGSAVARLWARGRRYMGSVTALALFAAAGFVALPLWGGLVVAGLCVGALELHVHVANQPPQPLTAR